MQSEFTTVHTSFLSEAQYLFCNKTGIQDNLFNQTRFWIISRKNQLLPMALGHLKKATLFITLANNQAGSLHKILECFAKRAIDLSKIESRPLKTSLGEYFFVLDLLYDDIRFKSIRKMKVNYKNSMLTTIVHNIINK